MVLITVLMPGAGPPAHKIAIDFDMTMRYFSVLKILLMTSIKGY